MNSRECKLLPVKGLRTPRIFLWFKGLIHGRVLHSGGLDPKTGTLTSGYITGQTSRFRSACASCISQVEKKLRPVWDNAGSLLIDYRKVVSELELLGTVRSSHDEKGEAARSYERAARRREMLNAERAEILKKLEIAANEIRMETDVAKNQIQATAEALLSTFACYGHGLLLKPVFCSYLPVLEYVKFQEQIWMGHDMDWNKINSILEEVK